ncbi:MAG: glutamate formimidoyltransferase [Chitinophagaceae bacterium]|nr:glutamate formimidoyltransferase [Chitinophagaceae bacterium]
MQKIIECVPNFSEGVDLQIIKQITDAIESVEGIKLLDVDPGKATNRTVVTFVGAPETIVEAAFQGIKKASELIDMRKHKGEHPRMGATDVCPFIPVSNVTMEECVACAKALGKKVAEELNIPVYLYESAAQKEDRKNLATIRSGEYEGFADKIKDPNWTPDFGKDFNEKSGATVIGARDFLVAYNVNLNTTSVRRANSVAFDLRENGRVLEENGKKVLDENGEPKREPGLLKSVKAIGWYIQEYGIAQISMNLTNISVTPLHIAFDTAVERAHARGMRVTGSELVGLVPLKCLLDAGKYFLQKQKRSIGVDEKELIKIAVKSMGLDELAPFDPAKKVIEYVLAEGKNDAPLINMTLTQFANETASESPAPGGGSISAYIAALGVSLGTMVANLSSHKKGWDEQWETFSNWAAKGQALKEELLKLVDKDTAAFNKIMDAFGLPKNTDEEKTIRAKAIQDATLFATEVPYITMQKAFEGFEICKAMVEIGNPNSITDAGVGVLSIRSAIYGAYLNVKINASGLKDKTIGQQFITDAFNLLQTAIQQEAEILAIVDSKM